MARKGWDALSDKYRDRLIRAGVTEHSYMTGVPLHSARGHVSANTEQFNRDSIKFAREYTTYKQTRTRRQVPFPTVSEVRNYVRSLGRVRGQQYMKHQRAIVRAYESGDTDRAAQLWRGKPSGAPDRMYYYHGIFGF